MMDIHCHILPGVDDGPANMEESLAMARLAVSDGIDTVFATPHVYPDGLTSDEIKEHAAALQKTVTAAGLGLKILSGGEGSSSLEFESLCGYLLHNGPYLLLEFPLSHLPADAPELIFELTAQGKIPIVTHPERNPDILRNPDLLAPLLDAGGLLQLTAESLTGGFGAESRACARHLLRRGWAHFLASDGHSATWRKPVLSKGLQVARKLIGADRARALVLDNPARVISGDSL